MGWANRAGSCITDAIMIAAAIPTGGASVVLLAAEEELAEEGVEVAAKLAAEAAIDTAAINGASSSSTSASSSAIKAAAEKAAVTAETAGEAEAAQGADEVAAQFLAANPGEEAGAQTASDAYMERAMETELPQEVSEAERTAAYEEQYKAGVAQAEADIAAEKAAEEANEKYWEEMMSCDGVNTNGLEGLMRTYMESQWMIGYCGNQVRLCFILSPFSRLSSHLSLPLPLARSLPLSFALFASPPRPPSLAPPPTPELDNVVRHGRLDESHGLWLPRAEERKPGGRE